MIFPKNECNNSKDIYSDFKELKKYEQKNSDYKIEYSFKKKSRFAILAIHGGRIENFTDVIAKDIANNDYSYYAFLGIKPKNNRILHITATCFDEPIALKIVTKAKTVITIHGCKNKNSIIHIGGLDKQLANFLKKELETSGFTCARCKNEEISGDNPKNICNKGKTKKGVQMEISKGLRDKFEHNGIKTTLYFKFIKTIRKVLKEYNGNY